MPKDSYSEQETVQEEVLPSREQKKVRGPAPDNYQVPKKFLMSQGEGHYKMDAPAYTLGVIAAETPIIDFLNLYPEYEKDLLESVGDWAIITRSYGANFMSHTPKNHKTGYTTNSQACQKFKNNWWKDIPQSRIEDLYQAYEETSDWMLWDVVLNGPAKASYADFTCEPSSGRRLLSPVGRSAGYHSAPGPLGVEVDAFRVRQPASNYHKGKTGASQIGYLQMKINREIYYKDRGYHIDPAKTYPGWDGFDRVERLAYWYPHLHLVKGGEMIDLAPIAQEIMGSTSVFDVPILGTVVSDGGLAGVAVNSENKRVYQEFSNVVSSNRIIYHGIEVDPKFRGVGGEVAFLLKITKAGDYDVSLNALRSSNKSDAPTPRLAAFLYGIDTNEATAVVTDAGSGWPNRPTSAGVNLPVGTYRVVVDNGPIDKRPDEYMTPFRFSVQER